MRSSIIFLVLILLQASIVRESWADDGFVFRKLKWGMTYDEVLEIESRSKDIKLITEGLRPAVGEGLSYETSWFHTDTSLHYLFKNYKLSAIAINLATPAFSLDNWEESHIKLKDLLIKKYGRIYCDADITGCNVWFKDDKYIELCANKDMKKRKKLQINIKDKNVWKYSVCKDWEHYDNM